MKTIISLFFLFTIPHTIMAQKAALIGNWEIIEFSITTQDKTDSTKSNINLQNEDSLRADSSIWTLGLDSSLSLVQTSNMRTGSLESWNGTWEATSSVLTLNMMVGERKISIAYNYSILDNGLLILTRSNPMGTMIIGTKFRKE